MKLFVFKKLDVILENRKHNFANLFTQIAVLQQKSSEKNMEMKQLLKDTNLEQKNYISSTLSKFEEDLDVDFGEIKSNIDKNHKISHEKIEISPHDLSELAMMLAQKVRS